MSRIKPHHLLIILTILLGATIQRSEAQSRIALVDRDAVLESMEAYTAINQHLSEISETYQEEYTRLSADIDRKFEDYQLLNTSDKTIPKNIQERRIQEIQNMQRRAQQFLITAEKDLKMQRSEMLEPVNRAVDEAIRKAAIEGNYSIVLPSNIPLYYSLEIDDLTERVKELVNVAIGQ